ncbi:MAG: hypothetical protein CL623_01855 [Arcobacter sp.]|nr:hypothetical protein [Arcobacter sp.]|tara:strand:- start:19315 stop:20130 length:816 start_codon:yes stop_codon:yes gene_type:complete
MSKLPLTATELMNYPVLYNTVPHEDASEKYTLISSIDVINELKKHNWHVSSIQVAPIKDSSRENKQVHLVRLRHFDDYLEEKESAVEILFFNSFDRSKAFQISIGLYRFCCQNGLILGDTYDSHTLRHIGNLENNLDEIITKITDIKPQLEQKVKLLSSLMLSDGEMQTFARLSLPLKFPDHLEVDYNQLLVPQRPQDMKDKSIYTILNIIQENLIRSDNVIGVNKDTGRKFKSKEITSLKKDYDINVGLFNLAERIYQIKKPETIDVLAA